MLNLGPEVGITGDPQPGDEFDLVNPRFAESMIAVAMHAEDSSAHGPETSVARHGSRADF